MDKRGPGAKTGKLPPIGNTVKIKKAAYTNDIVDAQLSVVKKDPDFDPAIKAVVIGSAKEENFLAGADIRFFETLTDPTKQRLPSESSTLSSCGSKHCTPSTTSRS